MSDFEAGGQNYRTTKLSARKAFHVSRRLAPVIGRMDFGRLTGGFSADTSITALLPLADALRDMQEADCDYVLDACLSACQRQQGASWAPVVDARTGRPMFEDIDLAAMMQIAMAVLQENLASFFGGLPAPSPGQAVVSTLSS